MTELTAAQASHAQDLRERWRRRLEIRESNYEDGGVERELSSFFSGLAMTYHNLGIIEYYCSDMATAQSDFQSSAAYYLKSAEADTFPVQGALALANGIFDAALAGAPETLTELCTVTQSIHADHAVEPGEPNSDRYYLAGALVASITEDIDRTVIDRLETVNEAYDDADALYGGSVVEFARGMRSGDIDRIDAGIEQIQRSHRAKQASDDVVAQIMAPEATALTIFARALGYEPTVSSAAIPTDLVEAAAPALGLA